MGAFVESDEELTAVGCLSAVGHAYQTCSVHVAPAQILIFKVTAVDAVAASTVAAGDVSALDHEVVDDTVEGTERIVEF